MAIKIGITGGIGSGKSTVCHIFRILGVPVFEADRVSKELVNKSNLIKKELINLFGPTIYTEEQVIDRKKLASIIFNDDHWLQKVNAIVHPEVRKEFLRWESVQSKPYVLHEAAILFESGFYKMMDQNILIVADEEIRIQRVTDRDKIEKEQVKVRISKQWPDDDKIKLADSVIYNNNDLLIPQVLKINKNIIEHGKIW